MASARSRRWVVQSADGSRLGDLLPKLGADADAVTGGRVFIGRRRATSVDAPIQVGDEVRVSDKVEVAHSDLRVLRKTNSWVAVDKPAGIPTIADPKGGEHSLQSELARTIGIDRDRLHPTSRLDRDVSGVVVFALSKRGREELATARAEARYVRRYIALSVSSPSPDQGVWNGSIGRARDPRLRMIDGRDPETAHTSYQTVSAVTGASLLALEPQTGRTHQLRVHASHAGAPLLGDRDYGGPTRITLPGGRVVSLTRIALHAARVSIALPSQTVTLDADVPPQLREWWSAFGGDENAWQTARICGISVGA